MTPSLIQLADNIKKFSSVAPVLSDRRCINLRHQRAGQCRACADACPLAAISMVPQPQIDETTCLACNACAAACPTGALQPLPDVIGLQRAALRTAQAGRTALVCRAVKGDFAAVRIPCLKALPAEFFVSLIVAGIATIDAFVAECEGCVFGPTVDDHLQAALTQAQYVLGPLGLECTVEIRTDAPPAAVTAPPAGVSRRGFFRTILATPSPDSATEDDNLEGLVAAGVGWRRALLLDALQRIPDLPTAALPVAEGHRARLAISNKCVGCEMCIQFCPTEALGVTTGENKQVTLWLDAARCTACGLCVRACFKKAISYTEEISLVELATSKYAPIWQGRQTVSPLSKKL
jgi:formate hydrogenlyase subunit 6/NADH:ubiquinone oxidoreductase subunit I